MNDPASIRWGDRLRAIPRRLVLGPIRFYQYAVSPARGARCKYYPTCSSYAVTAIERHGALKGTGLALWRLARCNPWSKGGVDYVPAARTRGIDTQGAHLP